VETRQATGNTDTTLTEREREQFFRSIDHVLAQMRNGRGRSVPPEAPARARVAGGTGSPEHLFEVFGECVHQNTMVAARSDPSEQQPRRCLSVPSLEIAHTCASGETRHAGIGEAPRPLPPFLFLEFPAFGKCVCVFITAVPSTKLFARGGGGGWRTCATRDYDPRPM